MIEVVNRVMSRTLEVILTSYGIINFGMFILYIGASEKSGVAPKLSDVGAILAFSFLTSFVLESVFDFINHMIYPLIARFLKHLFAKFRQSVLKRPPLADFILGRRDFVILTTLFIGVMSVPFAAIIFQAGFYLIGFVVGVGMLAIGIGGDALLFAAAKPESTEVTPE